MSSLQSVAPPKGAIVYLTQVRHSSYEGRDSLKLLRESLDSLARHYLHRHRDDVLLLHNGDFDEPLQASVKAPFGDLPIKFVLIDDKYWSLPKWLNESVAPLASPRLKMSAWRGWQFGFRYTVPSNLMSLLAL